MSTLIVSVDFPPHKDGVSRVAGEIASWLSKKERVVVIGPQDRGAREYDLQHGGYIALRTPLYNWGYLRFIPILFCMPYAMLKYRIKRVFAMNVAYGGILCYVLSGIFQPRRLPVGNGRGFFNFSYILFAYGYEFCKYRNNSLMKKILLKVYSGAERVIAISNFVKEKLVEFGVNTDKITIIKPGVQLDRFKPIPADRFKPIPAQQKSKVLLRQKNAVLLSVSRLVERKGHDVVLRALSKVKERIPDVRYLIVGTGPAGKSLRKLSRKLRLQDNVAFLGKVPDEELLHLYNLCDAFIMVSRDIEKSGHVEGFGIVYLEANACGKPVIGGRTGGASEAIIDGKTGILVDPSDVEGISEALLKLLEDKAYAEWLGRNGLDRVQRELNWNRFFEEFEKI